MFYIAFDSDIIEKRSVQAENPSPSNRSPQLGARIWADPFTPKSCQVVFKDPKNGLDDFIIRHGYKAFLKLLESAVKLNTSPMKYA